MNVADAVSYSIVLLLLNLSDNNQNQVQSNTVGVQQKEADRGMDLNPRPPTFQDMPNVIIVVEITT